LAIRLEDEGLHAHDQNPDWQESVFLAWRDPISGIGGNHRIGNEINRGLANMWCGVYADSGKRFRLNGEGLPFVGLPGYSGLQCGPQKIFHDGRSVRLLLDTDECKVDLEITDIAVSEHWLDNKGSLRISQSDHYDIHCLVKGTARIGDVTTQVSGDGWRDHSWGVRRWDEIVQTRCFSGHFGESFICDFFSMVFSDGSLVKAGRITRDGHREEIDNFEITIGLSSDGITAKSATVRGLTRSGSGLELNFALADGVIIETRGFVGFESIGELTMAPAKKGFGYFAFANRAGKFPPNLALYGVLRNGISQR
jgi:hypothetical protein